MSTPDDPFRKAAPAQGDPAPYTPPGYRPAGYPPPGPPPAAGYASPPTGYPPPGGPVQGYPPQPGYGYGSGPQQTSTRAVVALVCAIASFLVFPLVPAIAALVLARGAQREIATSGGRLAGEGLVTGARVTAWINIVLSVLALVGIVVLVLVAIADSSTADTVRVG